MSSPAQPFIASWEYRDMDAPPPVEEIPEPIAELPHDVFTEEQMNARIHASLADARRHWEAQSQERDRMREARLGDTLAAFAAERAEYFKQVEGEIVQLSLAIARKILERETVLDPTLLSGLVRIALDRLGTDAPVRVRVAPEAVASWQHSATASPDVYDVIADRSLADGECFVETSLGTADFGLDAQLKEIERSFLDLLAKRPDSQG